MFVMKGKYNAAKVYLDESDIDETTKNQIQTFLNHPAFTHTNIAIMPDCHAGKGAVVGFTMTMNEYIIPNLVGVDIGCFTGDTKIPLLNGFQKTLKELYDEGKQVWVYSLDENSKFVPGFATPLQTRKAANLMEIIVSGGEAIRCTPDHKFMLLNGSYKEAKVLKLFDSLMPLYRSYESKDGYEHVSSFTGSSCRTHKSVAKYFYGEKKKDDIVHHKDGLLFNNDPDNLEYKNKWLHSSDHRKKKPIFGTDDFKKKRKMKLEKDGYYKPELYATKKQVGIKNLTDSKDKWIDHAKGVGRRNKKYIVAFNKKNNSTLFECDICGRKIYGKGALVRHQTVHSKNHKVISVCQLSYTEDVYCLSVEKYHNFALSAGVFVHNCGILSYNLGTREIDLKELDKFVTENIPSGFKVYNHKNPDKWVSERMLELLGKGQTFILEIRDITKKINPDKEAYFFNSLGTLGGGNHYIEFGEDSDHHRWLTIHSGSRNFGLQIANYHQKKAVELSKRFFKEEKDLAFLPMEYGGKEYLEDMKIAQKYASLNRKIMMQRIIEGLFKIDYNEPNTIESVHNYIDLENKIIRKGAISAQKDEIVIIPFNMKDGMMIGKGKGNKDWNYSAPHGAGRRMSRTNAKKELSMESFTKSMEGIYTTSVTINTLEEAPMAYKPMNLILKNIEDTVEPITFVKPLWNFKAKA